MKAFAYNWPLTCVSEEKDEKRSQALVNFIQIAAFILLFLTFIFSDLLVLKTTDMKVLCVGGIGEGVLGFELSRFCIIINMISDFPQFLIFVFVFPFPQFRGPRIVTHVWADFTVESEKSLQQIHFRKTHRFPLI